jgi:predicted O-methyltransferase YrrM
MHTWNGFDTASLTPEQSYLIDSFLKKLFVAHSTSSTSELLSRCQTTEQRKFAAAPLGEHYRLLQSVVHSCKVTRVVEVGTFTGMSAVQLFTAGARVDTFDILPWQSFPNSVLTKDDFDRGHVRQHLGNLAEEDFFRDNLSIIQQADMIFIDGPKDGIFEEILLKKVLSTKLKRGCFLLLDDIYFDSMVPLWENIVQPHFDLSVIGHASGTGLVFPNSFFE